MRLIEDRKACILSTTNGYWDILLIHEQNPSALFPYLSDQGLFQLVVTNVGSYNVTI